MSKIRRAWRMRMMLGVMALGWVGVAPGQLVITEFMADTSHADGDLEWFELYSRTPTHVDLSGWKIGDDGALRGTLGEGVGIDPGGYVIFTSDSERFLTEWPEVTPAQVFSWTGSFTLANTSDEIFLFDPLDQLVASVLYTDGDPGEEDISVYLKYEPGALDDAGLADWREASGPSHWSASDPTVSGAGAGNVADPLAMLSLNGSSGSPGTGAYAAPIPEPGAVGLWCVGFLAVIWKRVRRRGVRAALGGLGFSRVRVA
ncbi:MAG: lamin tail domain-containing protein [Verrucomicrobiota bacterium]|jgi:hypothetical protein|nr:lamin tail domain-containing protein [Verrucomicrobiota bacterium]MDD8046201.1 lamin tail domain-containing protein [Verrucomicrobiota bacterium]